MKNLIRLAAVLCLIMELAFLTACAGDGGGGGNDHQTIPIPAGTLTGIVVQDVGSGGSPLRFLAASATTGTEPVANAKVKIKGTGLTATTDSEGKFEITGVPSGALEVVAEADEDSDGNNEMVKKIGFMMPGNNGLHLGWLKLDKTGEIAGKATLAGALSGNLGIIVFVPGTSYIAITDDAGNYVISWVPEGTYEVAAMKDDYCPLSVTSVAVVKDARTQGINLDLSSCAATGKIKGNAFLQGSADHSGILVELVGTAISTTTDAAGLWQMDSVPVGIYQVRFSKTDYSTVIVNNALALEGVGYFIVSNVFLNLSATTDSDGDGLNDAVDTDDDNDGVPDVSDAFPLNPSESVDTDGDGIGNNADPDDDNDTYADIDDDFPLDPTEWLDTDGDGIGNNADPDDDNDGHEDEVDDLPLDPTRWDITPPETTITSQPSNPSNSADAYFEFSCTESPCTFECNLDSAGWSACSSPITYGDGWIATSTAGAPSARTDQPAIWTGTEMIVWGGLVAVGPGEPTDTGARYNPTTDSWAAMTSTNAPSARSGHRMVWTGAQIIVWGGYGGGYLNTGGQYVPATNTWTATSLTGVPSATAFHSQIWTGNKMIIWGGDGAGNTGAQYDPSGDSWTPTSTAGAPLGRTYHSAVWTGEEMIVWGGNENGLTLFLNSGGRYNPIADTWSATSLTNAPSPRDWGVGPWCIWTGSRMLVWGGRGPDGGVNTGGLYNPTLDSWTAINTANAPSARYGHTIVWAGTEAIIWGGYDGSNYFNAGAKYNPSSDSWAATSMTNVPAVRLDHSAIWTGAQMIIWGGCSGGSRCVGGSLYNTGGRYSPTGNLSEGDHTFAVRAYDSALNVDPTPAVYNWTIGMPLDTTITVNPYNPTISRTAFFEFFCNKPPCTYECNLDSAGWSACSSPITYGDGWITTSTTGAPSARYNSMERFYSIWTGSEMIVWGGFDGASYYNTGGRYNPVTDSWTETSTTNEPSARDGHVAVWTGGEMVVWGGWDGTFYFNTGGRYNPATDSWITTSTSNAPSARGYATAVLTGTEMIIWGGAYQISYLNTGGRYNPSTDIWTETSTTNAPSIRWSHTAVWTGEEMVIWGGYNADGSDPDLNTGGKYNPSTDSWIATSMTNAPSKRDLHAAIWTGSEMIVWGGQYWDGSWHDFNDGYKYYPGSNSWAPISSAGAPPSRSGHTAIWTGTSMIVWGGHHLTYSSPLDTGGIYTLSSDTWSSTPALNAPSARLNHAAVWTGTEMIVWGGWNSSSAFNTGGILAPALAAGNHSFAVRAYDAELNVDPTPASYTWQIGDFWLPTSTTNAPEPRQDQAAVWTGSEMIIWGGNNDTIYFDNGGRYNPVTDSWTVLSTENAPEARGYPKAVWTGTEMVLWGGCNGTTCLNVLGTGGKYNPALNSWCPISTTNAPSARWLHTVVWDGSEMIVWGGFNGVDENTGARYNVANDTWTATNTTNAPLGRWLHTAIWDGKEMIVWGGQSYADGWFNTGGKYNPASDSWTATDTTNAPSARRSHRAVWTGTEMIIWGGGDSASILPNGGIYNAAGDSWRAMSSVNNPGLGEAVWTGHEMILWHGSDPKGARYNIYTNSWQAISIVNAPSLRNTFTAVWAGTSMIIWGGYDGSTQVNTGGRYWP